MKRRVRILGLLLFAGSVCPADTVETLLTRDREFAKSSAARGVEAWKEFLAERVVKFDAKLKIGTLYGTLTKIRERR